MTTPANLSCQSNADCEVVSTGCGQPKRSACGQALLNHSAATSVHWTALQSELTGCANECAHCSIALIPTCDQGFCGGPP